MCTNQVDDKILSWNELQQNCMNCDKCQLCKSKINTVFGEGNVCSDVMFIGEAPGQMEDETGRPFVGPAGQLLDDMLLILGLQREKIYITNILKCRPPNNRDPLQHEQDACIGFLDAQMKMVNPKFVICLGRIAAMRLISPDFKITRQHGQFVQKPDYTITALYHPSALLRDVAKRPETFYDLKKIKKFIADNFEII